MRDRTKESPLDRLASPARQARAPATAGIRCWEQAFLGHINLRGDARDPQLAAAVQSALGMALPVTPNTTAAGRAATIYWLGPDEWLVVTAGERERDVAKALRDALGATFSSVTEVGGGQTVVVLRGAAVRDLLAKECPLDFDPRFFPVGTCAQSRLAKAPVLLRPLDGGDAFEIVIRRSFADYFWLWLEDAAAEYGLAVTPDALPAAAASGSDAPETAVEPALRVSGG